MLFGVGFAAGTTYLLNQAPKRNHTLCPAIRFAFTVVTVLTAGVASAMGLAAEHPVGAPAEQLSLVLICWRASIMLVLSRVIVLDAMGKWTSILSTPLVAAVTETA